ncbi:MAG: hypothetical protein ACM3SS_01055 [Rhodospirillaceae bacterium]
MDIEAPAVALSREARPQMMTDTTDLKWQRHAWLLLVARMLLERRAQHIGIRILLLRRI